MTVRVTSLSPSRVISRGFRSARREQAPPPAASAPSHTLWSTLTLRQAPWCLWLPPRPSLQSEGTHMARNICRADNIEPLLRCSPARKQVVQVGRRCKATFNLCIWGCLEIILWMMMSSDWQFSQTRLFPHHFHFSTSYNPVTASLDQSGLILSSQARALQ